MKRTLLAIGYVWPEPQSSAAGQHFLSILKAFQSMGWKVVFASAAKPTEFIIDLSQFEIGAHSIELNSDSFNQFCQTIAPEAVLFDRYMTEEQYGWRVEQACPHATRILDTEDLQFLRNARHQAVKQNRELSTTDLYSDIAVREIASILRSDLSLIISDVEYELLVDQFHIPDQQLLHLPFLIERTPDLSGSFDERQHYVTIGNFRHAPNWDSVLELQRLWPTIRSACPEAELHIYGSYAPPKATALDSPKLGFRVLGRAENALDVVRKARVLLAPLRFGAGIKGKLMDAFLVGTPSVTSIIGAEGMAKNNDWPGAVTENDRSFIDAAIELYQSKTAWEHAQEKIKPLLSSRFETDRYIGALRRVVTDITQNTEKHRSVLFYNKMLRHHSMRSTEFMSRWIDAKNNLEALARRSEIDSPS